MIDPCDPSVYPPKSVVGSAQELNQRKEWFADPMRSSEDNAGPHIVVVDDFYHDPGSIRELALQKRFEPYYPPSAERVGKEIARQYQGQEGLWSSTAFVVFLGQTIKKPFIGERYNPAPVRERLAQVVGENVNPDTWDEYGDHWNGAFHLIDSGWKSGRGFIHHHYKKGDVEPRGWSGLVYLSPDAPPSSGTSIWRETKTGLCVVGYGARFDPNVSNFDLALFVENRFNRLVPFRENVLHRAEHGFGHGMNARLTQTFFFRTSRMGQTAQSAANV